MEFNLCFSDFSDSLLQLEKKLDKWQIVILDEILQDYTWLISRETV